MTPSERELAPGATVVALLVNPIFPPSERLSRELVVAARSLGLNLHVVHASTERDIDEAFASVAQLRAGGLVIGTDAFFTSRNEQLGALTLRHAVPTIYEYPEFASAGGHASASAAAPPRQRGDRMMGWMAPCGIDVPWIAA